MGSFFIIDRTLMEWHGGHEFFALAMTPNAYFGDVQKDD